MAAEDAGAAAAIIINNEDRLMPMGEDSEHKPTIPSIHLPLSGGQALRDALAASSGSLWATLRPSQASVNDLDASASAVGAAEGPVAEAQNELSDTEEMAHAAGSQACHNSQEGLQGQEWCAAGRMHPAQSTDEDIKLREDKVGERSDSKVQPPDEARGQQQVITAPASSAQREAEFEAAEAQLKQFNTKEPGRSGPHVWRRLCIPSKPVVPCLYQSIASSI